MSATQAGSAIGRNFRRVTKRELCPICKHPDWCRVFDDGAVECMRIESSTPCSSGGWMHWPNGRGDWRDQLNPEPARIQERPKTEETRPSATKAQTDAAYRELLQRCPLSDVDRAHLQGRGLTDEQIGRHGYATLPADPVDRLRIAREVEAALGWDPAGVVAGFIRKSDGRLDLMNSSGILIPDKNVRGQIRGLQLRLSNPRNDLRYLWFSCGDKPGSVGQNGNICHVARPARPASPKRVIVIEGPIKANIVADRLRCIVLGVAGVANIAGVLPAIKTLGAVEGIAVEDVAIAYDEEVNPQTALHETKLALELDDAGLRIAQLTWSSEDGKGLDDLLATDLLPFPIPHPALNRDKKASSPEDEPEVLHELLHLKRLHSLSTQARRSPNLGAERHLLTDLALALAGEPEGQPVPMPYKKLGDQAGVSASTAERQLGKVGIRPSTGDAGILAGLIAVEVLPVPERRNEGTGEIYGGYDALHVRRLAPVRDILERIATAPAPEKGKRNGHGGKRLPCPKCGETAIQRTITDRCAGCGELIDQVTRIIAGDDSPSGAPPTASCGAPPNDAYEHKATPPQDAAPASDSSSASGENDEPSVNISMGQQTAAHPPTARCGAASAMTDREARRAQARADLEARYGKTPPAWQDLAAAQDVINEASKASWDEHEAVNARLAEELEDIARARGRTPVPKPGGRTLRASGDALPRRTGCVQCGAAVASGQRYCEKHGGSELQDLEPQTSVFAEDDFGVAGYDRWTVS